MTKTEWIETILADVGADDADRAVAYAIALDEERWHLYAAQAARRQIVSELKTARRKHTAAYHVEAAGQEALDGFEPSVVHRRIREQIIDLDGVAHDVLTLTGEEGAAVLRRVARRDSRGATTTLDRCSFYEVLADRVVEQTRELGRPVAVSEVVASRQAAA